MREIFSFCKDYLKKERPRLIAYVFVCILISLCSVAIPYLSGSFLDALSASRGTAFIQTYSGLLLLIGIFEVAAGYLSKRLYNIIQINTSTGLNAAAVYKVQNTTSRFVQGENTAFLNQQINNDACDIMIFCIDVLHEIPTNCITLIAAMVILFKAQPMLGWVVVLLNVLYYFAYMTLRKPMYRRKYQTTDSQYRFFAKMDEQLSNVKFLQTHGISRTFVGRMDASVADLLRNVLNEQKITSCFDGISSLLKILANIAVFYIGGAAVLEKRLTIGTFSILMSYFTMSMTSAHYFFGLGKSVQESMVSCDRLGKLFALKEQTSGSVLRKNIEKITCTDVGFRYPKGIVFQNLNLNLEKGKVYGLVGENGAGKSTLLQILLGVYVDEYSGQVAYDGIPIEALDMPTLRGTLIGVSEQEPDLLPETLRYNLTLSDDPQHLEDGYKEFSELLNIDAFIRALPNGLDTQVSEGTCNLSGGEKQKISILRALLKKPKLLILDEPTSALDCQSRTNLCTYLHGSKQDRITILSTHDKELLDICDEIITIPPK